MRFLKSVVLDHSDARLFAAEGAAREGEWVVSGGYAVATRAPREETSIDRRDNTFVGVASHGLCTIAEVCEIDAPEYRRLVSELAQHFVDDLGAPTLEAATAAAEEECAYTADLCATLSVGIWLVVRRERTADGVSEHYSVSDRLMIGSHPL